jgi:TrmH family RNA methyltransferase
MPRTDNAAASIQKVLSRVRALQRNRFARDSSARFWVEGVRQFVQASDAHLDFDTVVYSKVLLKSGLVRMLIGRLRAAGVRVVDVTPEQFRGVSLAERASGVAAIVKQPWTKLAGADPHRGLCWLVLESVRLPGNLGTMLRTAEATGVAGVIFLGRACDPFDPPVVRASMGGIFHLQFIRSNYGELRSWATHHGVKLIGLSPNGNTAWNDCRTSEPIALLVGEERQGLSAQALARCDATARLPMFGRADSLNITVATGVMLYELLRVRSTSG